MKTYTYKGATRTLEELQEICIVSKPLLVDRLDKGWDVEKALFTPAVKTKSLQANTALARWNPKIPRDDLKSIRYKKVF